MAKRKGLKKIIIQLRKVEASHHPLIVSGADFEKVNGKLVLNIALYKKDERGSLVYVTTRKTIHSLFNLLKRNQGLILSWIFFRSENNIYTASGKCIFSICQHSYSKLSDI